MEFFGIMKSFMKFYYNRVELFVILEVINENFLKNIKNIILINFIYRRKRYSDIDIFCKYLK